MTKILIFERLFCEICDLSNLAFEIYFLNLRDKLINIAERQITIKNFETLKINLPMLDLRI